MSVVALLLVLSAAIAHAIWNIVAHGASRSGIPFLWWGSVFATVLWVGVIPFTGGFGTGDFAGFTLGILVSAVLHVCYMLVLQRGYARGELSTVYATARGSGPLLTVCVAILILGEQPSWLALSGVGLVLLGVVAFGIIGRRPAIPARLGGSRAKASEHAAGIGDGRGREDGRTHAKRWSGMIDPAIGYGLLTGAAIAAYTIWDAYAVNTLSIAPVAFMVGCTAAEIPFFTAALLRRGRAGAAGLGVELRTNWRRLLVFGVFSPLSYILVLTAVTMAPVSLVAPMREVSVVLVGLYGAWRFRESRPVLRILAALVVVAGVLLIGL